jgi:RHS repeat-associated protein
MPEMNFFWDPLSDNILQERDETGAVTAEYTAEPGLYGNIISQNRGGVESQFHYDAQGSTLAVTDDNQNVTDTFAYTAFGEVTERTGTTEVPFQYIGQKGYYTDGLTGQIMARRRPYEPVRARWLSADPLGKSVHHNLYNYGQNEPTRHIDPSGLQIAPTPAYITCLGLCDAVYPAWWQALAKRVCYENCGRTEQITLGIPVRFLNRYGRYCSYFRAVPSSCVCVAGRYVFTGTPVPWDDLDAACAEHECCATPWSSVILRWDECNRPLCRVAFAQLFIGCRDSMTPEDCKTAAAAILASPLCSTLPTVLSPLPF